MFGPNITLAYRRILPFSRLHLSPVSVSSLRPLSPSSRSLLHCYSCKPLENKLTAIAIRSYSSNSEANKKESSDVNADPSGVPPPSTVLYTRPAGIGRITPLLTFLGSSFHVGYWTWYNASLAPLLITAGHDIDPTPGYIGLALSGVILLGTRYFGTCLVHSVTQGDSQRFGDLEVVTYGGWFNGPEKEGTIYKSGDLRIVDGNEGRVTDGGRAGLGRSDVIRRPFGATRDTSYVPVRVCGERGESMKFFGVLGGNLLLDANNGQVQEGWEGKYLEDVLRGRRGEKRPAAATKLRGRGRERGRRKKASRSKKSA